MHVLTECIDKIVKRKANLYIYLCVMTFTERPQQELKLETESDACDIRYALQLESFNYRIPVKLSNTNIIINIHDFCAAIVMCDKHSTQHAGSCMTEPSPTAAHCLID